MRDCPNGDCDGGQVPDPRTVARDEDGMMTAMDTMSCEVCDGLGGVGCAEDMCTKEVWEHSLSVPPYCEDDEKAIRRAEWVDHTAKIRPTSFPMCDVAGCPDFALIEQGKEGEGYCRAHQPLPEFVSAMADRLRIYSEDTLVQPEGTDRLERLAFELGATKAGFNLLAAAAKIFIQKIREEEDRRAKSL